MALMAELGVADKIAQEPQTPGELARACGVNADVLMRMLRYLAANGIFAADDTGAIHNTPTSELLRDVPGSQRDQMRASWQDVVWDSYRRLDETLRTGQTAFDVAFGLSFFEYLAKNPEIGARFNASMALMSAPENAALAAAYPFRGTVVDVGGGRGGLIAAILQAHAGVRGVLYDRPEVLQNRNELLVADQMKRCTLVCGDFFASVPGNADLYVLKRILHDWDDSDAIRILRSCRAAMQPDARILVVDAVLKPGNDPDPNKMLDLGIMALTHGRERTAMDFQQLFDSAGLKLVRIIPPAPPSPMSIIEGTR